MKATAFVIGLVIAAVGAIGVAAPSVLVWISQRFGTPAEWYAIGVIRVAIGGLLLAVARTSRAPTALRVVAFIPLLAGIGALATPSIGLERAHAMLEWWSHQGPGMVRLPAVFLLALGGFIAYACGPAGRAA